MEQQEIEDEMDIKAAQSKKNIHKAQKKIKNIVTDVIDDEKGQGMYFNNWIGIIIFIIILLVVLRIFGLI